ncbi:MAG TPA: GNAT family N-acetyltransferase [Candidatus Elarobacter sp.]
MEAEPLRIRRARGDDAPALTTLAIASKQHWGYDADFMALVRPALAPSPDDIENNPVFIIESSAGEPAAFYGFKNRGGDVFLEDMWVHPARIGTGLGRILWNHALATAQSERYHSFLIESDPNAEPFYLHCGAQRAGEMVSPATGRVVPLLRVDVPPVIRGA